MSLRSARRLPSWFWEVTGALLLLTWRICGHPLQDLWRDWIVILSAYWIFAACAPKSRARPAVTAGVAFWLFAVYAWRQIPLVLDSLRFMLWS